MAKQQAPESSEANQLATRKTVVVILDIKRKAIHFTNTKLQGDDVWFPHDFQVMALFPAIENIMVMNHVAHNVASVGWLRRCGACEEYLIIYNEPRS